MEKYFCRAGNCWCDKLKTYNGKCNWIHNPNASCDGVYKDNGPKCGHGSFFVCQGYCPFEDKEHTVLTKKAYDEGFRIKEKPKKNERHMSCSFKKCPEYEACELYFNNTGLNKFCIYQEEI